jgi:hypothetical protein
MGGLAWQEAQLPWVNGEAAWWQALHNGAAERGEMPVTEWQELQFEVNPAWVAMVWDVSR